MNNSNYFEAGSIRLDLIYRTSLKYFRLRMYHHSVYDTSSFLFFKPSSYYCVPRLLTDRCLNKLFGMSDKVHDNFYHSILFLRTAFGNEQSKGNKPLHSHIFSGVCCFNSTKVRLRRMVVNISRKS